MAHGLSSSAVGGEYLSTGGVPEVHIVMQDLLYLQTKGTSLDSAVVGMTLVQDGQIPDGPEDPDDWPYQSVLEAIKRRLAGDSVSQSGALDG